MAKAKLKTSEHTRTFGPVSDLERHLPQDWWRTLFNSLYLKTDGDVVENESNTRREIDAVLRLTGVDKQDKIIDVCCGQGRHSLELARRGYTRVTGLDRSRYLIRLARRRAKDQNLPVTFREGDARQLRLPAGSQHAAIVMGNSFGYFEHQPDDIAVLETIKRALVSGGILFMDLVDGEWMAANFQPRSWEWVDQEHLVCRERSLASDRKRLVCREVVVHAERGIIADQFYAERLYTRDEIKELLDRAGFEKIVLSDAAETESDRNQDLGMMSQRIFVVARRERVEPPKKKAKAKRVFHKVTVVMGDPSLPDEVKRDGQFNPEDIDTIDRLKRALEELTDYEFEYLNSHQTLATDLRQTMPEFVLNLCDEGFNNDAFKELHIPALMDLIGVPYSGAAPACLALCYNKAHIRAIAETIDVPVPLETYFAPHDQAATIPSIFPALLKPAYGDSSVGITKDALVHTSEQLLAYLSKLKQEFPGRGILVQEYLSGREFSVGIIGNPNRSMRALPILEVDFSQLDPGLPPILGYESKWLPDSPYWTKINYIEANIDEETTRRLIDYSQVLFERTECRDYARFDWRADAQGEVKLLEVNPNPGWCWDGKLNLMAGFAGMRYADLLKEILEAAQERLGATTNAMKESATA